VRLGLGYITKNHSVKDISRGEKSIVMSSANNVLVSLQILLSQI